MFGVAKEGGTAGFTSSLRRTTGPAGHPRAGTPRRRTARTDGRHRGEHLAHLPRTAGPDRPAGHGARDPRLLARERRVRSDAETQRRQPAMDLLRGPAHGERDAWSPPHRVASLQGRLPAVPHDEG